jgi:hypothetical protein
MLHRSFIKTMEEADKVFSKFHPMPNTDERSRLYKKWRCLLNKADELELAIGVVYEYDKKMGWVKCCYTKDS